VVCSLFTSEVGQKEREARANGRLSWKDADHTGLCGGLEHLKIETRLIDERFASVMGECEIVTLKVRRLIKVSSCLFICNWNKKMAKAEG
jgi:hypothetical protein